MRWTVRLRRVARDDVVVGEDEAVRVEDDAGAGGRPWAVWPVVGSVSVTFSATIVTTAGLTALTMSTIEPWPTAGAGAGLAALAGAAGVAGLATAGLTTGFGVATW